MLQVDCFIHIKSFADFTYKLLADFLPAKSQRTYTSSSGILGPRYRIIIFKKSLIAHFLFYKVFCNYHVAVQ